MKIDLHTKILVSSLLYLSVSAVLVFMYFYINTLSYIENPATDKLDVLIKKISSDEVEFTKDQLLTYLQLDKNESINIKGFLSSIGNVFLSIAGFICMVSLYQLCAITKSCDKQKKA